MVARGGSSVEIKLQDKLTILVVPNKDPSRPIKVLIFKHRACKSFVEVQVNKPRAQQEFKNSKTRSRHTRCQATQTSPVSGRSDVNTTSSGSELIKRHNAKGIFMTCRCHNKIDDRKANWYKCENCEDAHLFNCHESEFNNSEEYFLAVSMRRIPYCLICSTRILGQSYREL